MFFSILSFPAPIILATVPGLSETHAPMGPLMTQLALQLAVIMIAAQLGGYLFSRITKGPSVLGELLAGMLIGPYALGACSFWGSMPLFPLTGALMPVSSELYGIATLASIVLLFLSGLETDLATFMRYSVAGMMVGLGGLFFSFIFGDLCAVWFGIGDSFMDPAALFMGTIATATSVGLTARILSEKSKMGSPEGVTILAGAVLDDVFGIVILAVVVGMAKISQAGGSLDWVQIGILAAKAIGFWIGFTALGLLLATRVTRLLKKLQSPETIASICLGLALLLAGLSEKAGLAMIIGAYIMGLSLSRTDLAYELQGQLRGLYNFLIPVFFCVMGMLVDFSAMQGVIVFGLVYSIIAILTKVIGCGLPAWLMKFSVRGALRVGLGMVPRAEVALIVAGVALSTGAIGSDVFGVAIMMSMLSTLIAPPLLIKAFEGGSGLRGEEKVVKQRVVTVSLDFPSDEVAEFLTSRIMQAFRNEEFFVHRLHTDIPTYQIRKEEMSFSVVHEKGNVKIDMPVQYQYIARLIILEELLALQDLLDSVKQMRSPDAMGAQLMTGLFDQN